MKLLQEKIKKILNKDITHILNKYKIPLITGVVVILLACIGIFISYGFYKVNITTTIVGNKVDRVADIDVRIMAQERDANGSGINKAEGVKSYILYPYIPQAGYEYNEEASYCTNNSEINYDEEIFNATISATGHDVCYLYFDSTANLDLTLYVYAENVDNDGNGTGSYTKLETTSLPTVGYKLHIPTGEEDEHRSYCENNSGLSYSELDNIFTIEASGKDVCYAYMDAVNVDISLKLKIQSQMGSNEYLDATTIPTGVTYELHTAQDEHKSACTGTSSLSLENQKVVISATSKTSCVAYLDISSGAALASLSLNSFDPNNVTATVTDSINSNPAATYYYSIDGGKNYASSSSNTYTFNGVEKNISVKAYSEDAYGNTSAILTVDSEKDYVYNGVFPYQKEGANITVEKSGYYYLQTWGAQGGYRIDKTKGGHGGYSYGYVYLNQGDILYVHTGGFGGKGENGCGKEICEGGSNGGGYRYKYYGGGGASDIRLNNDDLLSRIIVAGGGGSDGASNETGMYAGGKIGGSSKSGNSSVRETGGKGGNTTYSGAGLEFTISSQITTGLNSNTLENYAGGFGFGGGGVFLNDGYGGAGGGGWYGGSGNIPDTSLDNDRGGGGGSGFVYTENNANNIPAGYTIPDTYYLINAGTYAGNTAFESPLGISETGHEGNGYVKITYIGASL